MSSFHVSESVLVDKSRKLKTANSRLCESNRTWNKSWRLSASNERAGHRNKNEILGSLKEINLVQGNLIKSIRKTFRVSLTSPHRYYFGIVHSDQQHISSASNGRASHLTIRHIWKERKPDFYNGLDTDTRKTHCSLHFLRDFLDWFYIWCRQLNLLGSISSFIYDNPGVYQQKCIWGLRQQLSDCGRR